MDVPYTEIERDLQGAVGRGLRVAANAWGLEESEELFARVGRDPASGAAEVRALFGKRRPLALVGFDTPGIQEYVFKVQRPVDILGGSQLVADFTDPEQRDVSFYSHLAGAGAAVPPSTVIYAGGGGGLLLVAAPEAKNLVRTLEEILHRETAGHLRSVAEVLEVWPEDLAATSPELRPGLETALGKLREASHYAAAVTALTLRRDRARSRRAPLATSLTAAASRCHACGQQPSTKTRTYLGENEEQLCSGCHARWRYGRRGKSEAQEPRTFEQMVEGLDQRAIAVLYADGANVGSAFQQVQSPAQHRTLSLAVDAALKRAREHALAGLSEDHRQRVQTAICGGDDLVLILPAVAVFKVAVPLIETFEAAFDLERDGALRAAFAGAPSEQPSELQQALKRFGLGIGIAVADYHFPIQLLVDYARQLLKSAKTILHEPGGGRSAVDFLVLRSGAALCESISKLRRRLFERPAAGEGEGYQGAATRLTCRPYRRDGLARLLRQAELLGEHVPPAQIQTIRREVELGYEVSRSLWRYQHARAKDGEGWAAWRDQLGCDLAGVDALLWRPAPADAASPAEPYATNYLDLLEIFDLVNADRGKAAGAE